MSHQLTENVKFLHKVVIVRQEDGRKEALILHRPEDALSRPNCWDLPGGNVEWPAKDQVSVSDLHKLDIAREIKEESNLTVNPEIFTLAHLIYFSSYFASEKQIYTVICGWTINLDDTDQAEIKISDEHQAMQWVSLEQLPDFDFGGVKGEFVLQSIERALS